MAINQLGSPVGYTYHYDQLNRLKKTRQHTGNDGTNAITWSVYGKIESIYKTTGTISYTYDPSGQRVSKTAGGLTTYYIRDAQGNTLAIYDNAHSNLNWKEQQLYGSSRLGLWVPNENLASNNAIAIWDTTGNKQFELTNNLGNVLETISDKRLQHTTNNTTIDYYNADVATAQDYYPFGMLMPGRQYSFGNVYRYGFNGKENDNEVKGVGEQQNYGSRIYDSRVATWLSTDPLQAKYPEITPYSFAANSPINIIDVDGRDIIRFTEKRVHLREASFPSRANHGANFRDVLTTTYSVTVLQQPGEDKFFSDIIDIQSGAHNKPSIVSTQFYPDNTLSKRSGITQSPVLDFLPWPKMDDFDEISLEKLAPPL